MKKNRKRSAPGRLAMKVDPHFDSRMDFVNFFRVELQRQVRELQSFNEMDAEVSADLLNKAIGSTYRMDRKEFEELYNRNWLFTRLHGFRNECYVWLLAKAQGAVKKGQLSKESFSDIQTLVQEEVKSLDQIVGDDIVSMYKRLTPRQFVKYFYEHSFADQTLIWIIDYHQKHGMKWKAACKRVLDELESGGFPEKVIDSFQRNMRKAQKRVIQNLK